jgi:hypothetical protein
MDTHDGRDPLVDQAIATAPTRLWREVAGHVEDKARGLARR